jgi:hypothetical protein
VNGRDPEQLELSPPLPGDALRAKVTFLRARAGFGFKASPRSEATHARIEETGVDGQTRDRRMELEEATAYMAQVDSMHDETDRWDARRKEQLEEARALRGGRAAELSVDCMRCGVAREYGGQSNGFHQYACPRCGSVELFRPGLLEHPLPNAG